MAASHRYGSPVTNYFGSVPMVRVGSGSRSDSAFWHIASICLETPWRRTVRIIAKQVFYLIPWVIIAYFFLVPASSWVDVDKVFVANGHVGGESPKINVSWKFKKSFVMRWHTTLRQEDGASFKAVCWGSGASQQYPGREFPDHIDVDWWLQHGTCLDHLTPYELHAGRYYIETTLEWDDFAFVRSASINSNVFTVYPEVEDRTK